MRLGLELHVAEIGREVVNVDRRHWLHPTINRRTSVHSMLRSRSDIVGFNSQPGSFACRRTRGLSVRRTHRRSSFIHSVSETVLGPTDPVIDLGRRRGTGTMRWSATRHIDRSAGGPG